MKVPLATPHLLSGDRFSPWIVVMPAMYSVGFLALRDLYPHRFLWPGAWSSRAAAACSAVEAQLIQVLRCRNWMLVRRGMLECCKS